MTRITGRDLKPEYIGEDAYELLRYIGPGLMLDVGAASGKMSAKMLEASPQSRVVAFEPFPGNFPYIEGRFANLPNAALVKKAVSNYDGSAKFFVPTEGNWGKPGYATGGKVDDRGTLIVATCRLDDIVSEPVRFLKIDVQGHEFEVLDGARELFGHGVDLALVEFMGDERVIEFLAERGYAIFDQQYFCPEHKAKLKRTDWKIVGVTKLSKGSNVTRAFPLNAPESPKKFCKWYRKQLDRYEHIWTDLIAISPKSPLLVREPILSRVKRLIAPQARP